MKRFIVLFTLVVFFLTGLSMGMAPISQAAGDITVLVNNKKISFPDQKPYIDKNNRTLVPVRFISEALGADVGWDGDTQTVTITEKEKTIVLKIGQSQAVVNGQIKKFDTKAVISNRRTMVPLRFISECLGAKVDWIANTRTVVITVNNGYTIPENPSVIIEIEDPNNNPNKVDIVLTVTLGKDLEPQFNDVYTILESKFGPDAAKKVTDYIRQKEDRWSRVPVKWWTFNDQLLYTASNSGDFVVQITVWQPGVTKK